MRACIFAVKRRSEVWARRVAERSVLVPVHCEVHRQGREQTTARRWCDDREVQNYSVGWKL